MITDELEAWKYILERYEDDDSCFYICRLLEYLVFVHEISGDTYVKMVDRIEKEGRKIYPEYIINKGFPSFSRMSDREAALGRQQRIGLIQRFINELSKN